MAESNNLKDELAGFTSATESNFKYIDSTGTDIVNRTREIDKTLRKLVGYLNHSDYQLGPFFLIRAHSLYRSSIRVGWGGQLPDAYPLLRGCLEQCIYSWFLKGNDEAQRIWIKREDGEESKKVCRNLFKVGVLLRDLKTKHPKIGQGVAELYDNFIDFGAHPNIYGVFGEVELNSSERKSEPKIPYTYNDGTFLRLLLKDIARTGVGILLINELIYKERYQITGLSDEVQKLAVGL